MARPSEARLIDPVRAFVADTSDGVVASDADGRIVLVDNTLEEMSGYSADELIGRDLDSLIPDRGRAGRLQWLDRHGDPEPSGRTAPDRVDGVLRCKDGGELPVDVALSTLRLGKQTLLQASVRDATARRQAEAAVRESERRWQTLVETVRLVVVALDREGRVTYANPFLCELTGYREEELLGTDWFGSFLPETVSDEVLGVFQQLLTSDTPERYVNPIRTRTGQERVILWDNAVLRDLDGEAVGTVSIGEDITDRRLAQERLEAVNDVARAILDDRPLEEVFRTIARRSRALVEASNATIVTPETGTGTLVVQVADGAQAAELEGMRFPADGSISGQVMREREPLLLDDVSADPRAVQPVVRTAAVGPALFAPLAVADRAFGTLLVGRPLGGRSFTDEERRVIELFASQAAVALEHARYQEELHRLVVLEDRERIARELHDGAIQQLFATGMKLQAALGSIDGDAAERVRQAVEDLDGVIKELRGYIWGLRPGSGRNRELVDALHRLGRDLEESAGVVTVVDVDPDVLAAVGSDHDLVQFVREALSNVGRHARATTCRVRVARADDGVLLEVDDDGDGSIRGTAAARAGGC